MSIRGASLDQQRTFLGLKTGWLVDLLMVLFLIGFVVLFAETAVNFAIQPYEDAAMLMRYATHVAQGEGIVWNIGEAPVDGATDFLFMMGVALGVKAGFAVETVTRGLGLGAHLLTVILIYVALRRFYLAPVLIALISALYLAVGPGLYLTAAFFGTPVFALLAALTWCAAISVTRRGAKWLPALLFAFCGLIMGLIRPEGVFLAGLMLLSIIYKLGWRRSRPAIVTFVLVFTILGGAYFIWRWNYFGYPLPNPFYKKGGGLIYTESLRESLENVFRLALPFWLTYLLALRSRETTREAIFSLIPIVGFASAFLLLSNEMNFGARFQYGLLPIILLSWWPLLETLPQDLRLPAWRSFPLRLQVTLLLFGGALLAGVLGYQYQRSKQISYGVDGRFQVAQNLRAFQERDYTMVTSEAGLLPLYSGWRAVDAWGLNDQWIAHNGAITAEYLERTNPELIVMHAKFSPLVAVETGKGRGLGDEWYEMTVTLNEYALAHDYILAAAYGEKPSDAHLYYVRPDFADSAALVDAIQVETYAWFRNGRTAFDFARVAP